MLRVSTTSVEQFRRFMVYDYVQEPAMIANIRGIDFDKPWQMKAGKAFHTVLEKYDEIANAQEHAALLNVNPETEAPLFKPEGAINYQTYVQQGAYIFQRSHVAQAREKIGQCLWEVKGNRIFDTKYGPCNVIAKADNVYGLRVQDTKCKFGTKPDGSDWECDMQWRAYLLVHGAELFRYNAFTFKEPEEMHDTPGVFAMTMIDYISFNFWRYDNMEKDFVSWLNDFLDWADNHKLLPFLHREPKE